MDERLFEMREIILRKELFRLYFAYIFHRCKHTYKLKFIDMLRICEIALRKEL